MMINSQIDPVPKRGQGRVGIQEDGLVGVPRQPQRDIAPDGSLNIEGPHRRCIFNSKPLLAVEDIRLRKAVMCCIGRIELKWICEKLAEDRSILRLQCVMTSENEGEDESR